MTLAPGRRTTRSTSTAAGLFGWLFAPHRLTTLCLVSLGIGAAHAIFIFPVPLVLGTSDFWIFPHGTIHNSDNDMAQVLMGQIFLQNSPWEWPLLYVPKLGFPTGANIFWIDAVPIVALIAKLFAGFAHGPVNLLGFYLFACLVLPGIAMTCLAWIAGQQNLLAAITASAIADAAPTLLYRWGHTALMAQFLIVVALVLYLLSQHRPSAWQVSVAWLVLLAVTLLTAAYLFVMVGAVWVAALMQRRLNGAASTSYLAMEALAAVFSALVLMLLTGILTPGGGGTTLGDISAYGFGAFSTNLGSLFVPQMSGVVPGLSQYRIGMGGQYEGFGYVGAGTLLLLLVSLPRGVGWMRAAARRHVALIAVLVGSFLFALSNHVYLGEHLLFSVPVPYRVLRLFNLFQSSGRFVWLPGYAIMAGSIVLALRGKRSRLTALVCLAAAALQMLDAAPLRAAIEATALAPTKAVFDRDGAAALAARSHAIDVFPSYGCLNAASAAESDPDAAWDRWAQANLEFQLIAARSDLRINSVYQPRLPTDCRAEAARRAAPLRPGTLYIYLNAPPPAPSQLDGQDPAKVCGTIDWLRYCLIPVAGNDG